MVVAASIPTFLVINGIENDRAALTAKPDVQGSEAYAV
jgi:hypothetical protein